MDSIDNWNRLYENEIKELYRDFKESMDVLNTIYESLGYSIKEPNIKIETGFCGSPDDVLP